MNFLAPTAFAFAATLPVVILFYLLKRKRTVKLVPSTLLWQKFLSETQASAPFQRLRHNWLLIFQLLLLVLVILALARPFFAADTQAGRLLVVILDASASMQSTDETPSRFERARRAALQLVDSMHDTDQMVVLSAGGHTEVRQSPTSNKASLRRALEGCTPTDSPTRLAEALKLAQPLVRDRSDAEIHLYSDGAFGPMEEFEHQALPIEFHRFGQRGNNLGIVTLDARSHPEDSSKRAIFVSVANASTNAAQTQVELLFDGQMLEARTLELKPRETVPLVFTAAQPRDGVFTVRLSAPDDLATDNQASILSLLPQPAKVLLVTRGNRYLEKALSAAPLVTLTVASELSDEAKAYDITVLDEVLPDVWPAGNVLAVQVSRTNWLQTLGRVEAPQIVDWRNTHSLLRFVGFDNVRIADALAVKTPSWALSLVDCPNTPLILAGELQRQRIIWVGFDVLQSNWPLLISFPIFVANAVEWLNPATANAAQFQVRVGDPIRFPITAPLQKAVIVLPDHSEHALPIEPGARELVFGDTSHAGIYRLDAGTNQVTFCVNLLDAAESDTTPHSELAFGKYSKVQASALHRANMELWRWIAAAGLALLLFEWWYFHRRTA